MDISAKFWNSKTSARFWNFYKTLKFLWNSEISAKFWYCCKIPKFQQTEISEIIANLWNLGIFNKILKFLQKSEIYEKLDNSKLGSTQQWKQKTGDSGESSDSGESGDFGDSGESGESGDDDTLPGSYPHRKYMVCMV